MKFDKILFLIFFLCFNAENISAQNIAIDDTFPVQQLVENVLINSSCANVTNFAVSGGDFGTGEQSFGYFTSGTSGFPFANGIILSTGKATSASGPNDFILSEGDANWIGDSDLEQALGVSNSINATVLEFDFIPLTNKISFDYIFSSEQYLLNPSSNQCNYTDGFAFLLKEVSGAGQYQNLAIIPETNIPVKVNTVRGTGTICPSANESYFDAFNGTNHPTNFNGQTIVMQAEATVVSGTTYHIKLVISDQGNNLYDSAIFLGGGSFQSVIDLGQNRLIATNNPVCANQTVDIDATQPGSNTYQWFKNGNLIIGETNPIYTVTSSGIYKAVVTLNGSSCVANGEITLEYVDLPILTNPVTLVQCDVDNDGITTFDITKLNSLITQGSTEIASFVYYENLLDAQNQINNIANPTEFQNISTNSITVRITNNFGCVNYATINLQIANNTLPIINPIAVCDEDGNFDGFTSTDLNQTVTPQITFGLPPGLTLEYYSNVSDAVTGNNPLLNNFTNTLESNQIIFARIINGPDCYGIIPINLQIIAFNPTNFEHEDLTLCEGESYFLEVETGFLTYLWNTGETTSSIVLSAVGNYSVIVTNQFGCEATKTYTITSSSPPTITSIDINDFSGDNNTVQINVIGSGDYHYSLNGINFQDSSFFNNVITDEYLVVIKDKNGCNPEAMQQIYVLDYPKFFTPNGDGINDIWYIKKMEQQPNATISIFDRYGKLLYSFKANQRGWDGTFNQKALLSYDYWFVLNLENGRKIKGHFSLKR